jgi:DNA-binding CsgD family transcriptional regulator
VKFHVTAIMAKLDVKSRTEAVAVAIRRGLITVG